MKHNIDVTWDGGMAFAAQLDEHVVRMDAEPTFGGENKGPRPKPLMLASLGGCTGMDVISILRKMKIEPERFRLLIEGDVSDDHPKQYIRMHIIYELTGRDLPLEKIQQAVRLSQDIYCGVSAVYKKALTVTHEIRILEA